MSDQARKDAMADAETITRREHEALAQAAAYFGRR